MYIIIILAIPLAYENNVFNKIRYLLFQHITQYKLSYNYKKSCRLTKARRVSNTVMKLLIYWLLGFLFPF